MTQPATAPATPTAPAAPPPAPPNNPTLDVDGDFSSRVDAISAQFREEGLAERVAESDSEDAPQDATAVAKQGDAPHSPAAAAEATTPPVDAAAARRTRMDAIAARAREKAERKVNVTAESRELAELRAMKASKLPLAERFEKAMSDPDALLEMLSQHVPPEKLSEYLIEQGMPDKVAARRAAKAAEPVSAEVQALRAELTELRGALQQDKATAAQEQGRAIFVSRISEVKEQAPHTARLLEKNPAKLVKIAESVATTLPDGFTADDVIDSIEHELSELYGESQPDSPATNTSQTNTTGAAKSTSFTNRVAAERTSLLAEDEESLTLDERAARLERRVRKEQRSG